MLSIEFAGVEGGW
jgi:hypothetical protein